MSGNLQITVIGAGAWGTALACAMARVGHNVTLWGRNAEQLDEISKQKTNKSYLPDISLEVDLSTEADLVAAVGRADILFLVIPAQTIAGAMDNLKSLLKPSQKLILCAKGIDRQSGKTPVELVTGVLERANIGVLSGPSFATDVARGLPTAVTLAFDHLDQALNVAEQLSSDNFRIYASDDVIGVELGGALKNVLAVAVGITRGLGLGASAEAALIARGFGELRRIALKAGAQRETLTGLSGLGDLVLTASSTQSRNFSYGITLGRGESVENMPLAEGVFTARIAAKLAAENSIEAPIIELVAAVLDGKLSAREAVQQLLSRPVRTENE